MIDLNWKFWLELFCNLLENVSVQMTLFNEYYKWPFTDFGPHRKSKGHVRDIKYLHKHFIGLPFSLQTFAEDYLHFFKQRGKTCHKWTTFPKPNGRVACSKQTGLIISLLRLLFPILYLRFPKWPPFALLLCCIQPWVFMMFHDSNKEEIIFCVKTFAFSPSSIGKMPTLNRVKVGNLKIKIKIKKQKKSRM